VGDQLLGLHANGFGVLRWVNNEVDDPEADASAGQFGGRRPTTGPAPAIGTSVWTTRVIMLRP
jgi:hypothetical protein